MVRMKILAAVLLFASSSLLAADYSHSRAVAINHYKVQNYDQTGFVLMFTGTYPYLRDVAHGGDVESAGRDIVFTSQSSCSFTRGSRLPFERAVYDPVTGTVEFHVSLPVVTTGYDTTVYLCYGRANDTEHQNRSDTWPAADYRAVYHFGDGVTLSLNDSTTNNNHCTNFNGTAAAGIVGPGALHLTGGAYLNCGHNASLNLSEIWLEAAFAVDSMPPASFQTLVGKSRGTDGWDYLLHDNSGWTAGRMYAQFVLGGGYTTVGAFLPSAGQGYLATVVNDLGGSNYLSTWYNGNNDGVQAISGTITGNHASTDMLIGAFTDTPYPNYTWQGTIDELRLRVRKQGTDYMATERNMLADPATFYTLGPDVAP